MVSIIIPVYNAAASLRRCVESLINQTYKDIEIILVNDGSTDSSELICKEFESLDSRVHYFIKANGGAASARNYGIEKSRGEFIQFVDSDDYVEGSFLEKMISCQHRYNSDLVICGLKIMLLKKSKEIVYEEGYNLSIKDFTPYVEKYYNNSILHSLCTKLYRKNLITSLMNVNYRWGEDYIFNLNFLENVNSVSIIPEALYVYDCTQESLTRGNYLKQGEYIVKRYIEAKDIFSRLFKSEKIDSIVAERFIKDLLLDYAYATPLLKISSQDIQGLLQANEDAISKIYSSSLFSDKIINKKCLRLKFDFLKLRIGNIVKGCIKSFF